MQKKAMRIKTCILYNLHNRNMIWSDSGKSQEKIVKTLITHLTNVKLLNMEKTHSKNLPSFFADKVQKLRCTRCGAPQKWERLEDFCSGGQFGNSYFQLLTSLLPRIIEVLQSYIDVHFSHGGVKDLLSPPSEHHNYEVGKKNKKI